jgi:deazaflavin-dependent oxidoreductase (nitroreductase family)
VDRGLRAAPRGRDGATIVSVPGDDYCYLTTTGRRTGRAHRIEIWYAADGDTLYVLAGGGRSSDWVQNLVVDPSVRVELDGVVRPARARVLDAGPEAERARSLVFAKYAPRSDGDLTDWRERALPVALDLAAR